MVEIEIGGNRLTASSTVRDVLFRKMVSDASPLIIRQSNHPTFINSNFEISSSQARACARRGCPCRRATTARAEPTNDRENKIGLPCRDRTCWCVRHCCRHRRNYRRLNGKLLKVNDSLTTDRTVPNMQRLRTISMRQTKDFLQPQKRTPTEKMFKTWATLGQPAECHELSLRWSFMSNIRMVRRSGHSWPRMATSASIVAIFASFVALLWLFLHLL